MKLGTVVQVTLGAGLACVAAFEMLGALLSSPCTLTASDEFVDPATMFSSVCRVEMTCPDGPWSGEMGTTRRRGGSRHRDCADVGVTVRRSPLWLGPRHDGPTAGFKWTFLAAVGAAVAIPLAGRLNPRERLADRDPSYPRR